MRFWSYFWIALTGCAAMSAAAKAPGRPENGGSACFYITHSVDPVTITDGASVSCNTGEPFSYHLENFYLRSYSISTFGIDDAWLVDAVRFGIEEATSGGGAGQPLIVQVFVGPDGGFPGEPFSFELVREVETTVSDTTLSFLEVAIPPILVPAGSDLVVSINTPDGSPFGHRFSIGANSAGQTAPSYIGAPACGAISATDVALFGFPDSHFLIAPHGCPAIFTDGFESGDVSAWSASVP